MMEIRSAQKEASLFSTNENRLYYLCKNQKTKITY